MAQGYEALFAGEASCRSCHPGESALYHHSGHSQTLRRAADRGDLAAWLEGKQVADPSEPGADFHYRREDGRIVAERTSPGGVDLNVLDYAFGSGHHATTFVTMTDADPAHLAGIEHRMTAFAKGPRLDTTPGQGKPYDVGTAQRVPQGRKIDAEEMKKCFACHVTVLSDRGDETLDVATMVMNVSCERCHGPGKAHVEAAQRGESPLRMPFGPRRTSAMQEIRLCGRCHRLPEDAPAGAVRPDNEHLVRFPPVGLMASRCFEGSGGTLRCTTCHEPHSTTSTDAARYEAACLSCHKTAPQPVCRVSPSNGCIGCHMPRREVIQGAVFTDHWIRIHPRDGKSPSPH
ncbi:MAG TPA: multiheme c-type cytochrome [Isosphaeraceae bacterium]